MRSREFSILSSSSIRIIVGRLREGRRGGKERRGKGEEGGGRGGGRERRGIGGEEE